VPDLNFELNFFKDEQRLAARTDQELNEQERQAAAEAICPEERHACHCRKGALSHPKLQKWS
jgi:hypothetical protein